MTTEIYINLPVKDLTKSIEFFSELGFKFNPQFTDKNAACMIIGENIYAMLLLEEFFKTFTKKEIADSRNATEVINAFSVESREKVEEIIEKAVRAGGIEHADPQDLGWMYSRSFEDLDGHLWEVLCIEEK